MKVLVLTANIGDIDNVIDLPKQIVSDDIAVHYRHYTEKNLPYPLPNLDNRTKSKYLKIQTHVFEPGYDYYIWLDGRIEVISENFVTEMLSFIGENDIAIPLHDKRANIFEELEYIQEHINLETPYIFLRYGNQKMDQELEVYKQSEEQLKQIPLYHCACFIRFGQGIVNSFFNQWWEKCIQYSNFDQAMFSYTSFKNSHVLINSINREDLFDKLIVNNKHERNLIDLSSEDLLFEIRKSLIIKKPLAITRYGDGEAMVMDKTEESQEYKDFVFKRQLGDNLLEKHKSHIMFHLRNAYKKSDIIGIPTTRHKNKGGYWNKALGILESHVTFNKQFCSIDFHQEFLSNGYFDILLNNREKVFYISAYNIDNELKERYNIKEVQSFQIAPEMKFNPQYDGVEHYPTQFNLIEQWIKTLDCEGSLCLVGAGITGKLYNVWFKEQGGISLDIGSVFDAWAGKNTRGKNRSASAIDNTYKL